MKTKSNYIIAGILISMLSAAAPAASVDALETGFRNPPDSAKPRVYWFWMYNRVDKAGITRDLEEFKAKGISGVNMICNGGFGGNEPLFGVKYQSPEWWELFRHTVKEAKRLNIELGFNLSAGGWVMCGPWVTPDTAMKKVVQTKIAVEGPKKFAEKLPQPDTVDGYYRDYCVQALPLKGTGGAIKPDEIIDITDRLQPDGKLEWNVPEGRWAILRTGYTVTTEGQFKFPYPRGDIYEGGNGYQIDFLNSAAFDDHFQHLGVPILQAAREAGGHIDYLWSDSWEAGKLTWTQDFPEQFRKYRGYDLKPFLAALTGTRSSFWLNYTATFTATNTTQTLSFAGINLAGGDNTVFIDNVQIVSLDGAVVTVPNASFESPKLEAGTFKYNPTGGSWSFSGQSGICGKGSGFGNPATAEGSQAAILQNNGSFSQPITGLTPGTTYTLTFSAAERSGNDQTWNIKMDDVVIGSYRPHTRITILNDEASTRFRADFDRTIQDCVANNFYGHFADVCHSNGMKMGNEAAGPHNIPPEDALKNLGRCDFPAGEFWVNYNAPDHFNPDPGLKLNLKQTASAAHVYGLPQAEAESFTQQEGDRTHWSFGPQDLKPYANDAFCWGINRFMLHAATCQPPSDGKPGYVQCAGQHFTPNITWWEQSPAFFTFISRCSYMLQQGHFAADVCFHLGEEPPALVPPKYIVPGLGSGYDCDYSNAEVLLKRMSVKDGRIMLPDGMSYRLLVLQNCVSPVGEIAGRVGRYQNLLVSGIPSKTMSVEVIKKLRELVRHGATIVGAPPEMAAGLNNYPKCDEEVKSIAAEIWGDLDGTKLTERKFGKGRVIWGKTPREVLLADGVNPDFSLAGQDALPDQFDYIHRTSGDAEIYFVINRKRQPATQSFTFRVTGKHPEIFDPVSGSIRPANAFKQADGCTTLPLEFDRFGSCFVVFRQPIANGVEGKGENNFPKLVEVQKLDGPWDVAFDPAWGGPAKAEFPELISWTQRPEEGIKNYSGTATYRKTFDLPEGANNKTQRPYLDLGNVREVAEVRLNGQELGVLWCYPWRVEITNAVKPAGNVLEVDVVNLWANRVNADLNLPKDKRVTKTYDGFRFNMCSKDVPPKESGLLGPVTLQRDEK